MASSIVDAAAKRAALERPFPAGLQHDQGFVALAGRRGPLTMTS